MRKLSISQAWDETRAILGHDGRLFMSVALGLIALPTLITGMINPKGMTGSAPIWISLVSISVSLIALGGQLACIRLALGPSITVGAAIAHGMRRLPIYFLAVVILVVAGLLAAIPFALALTAMGVGVDEKTVPDSPPVLIAVILYACLIVFVMVRMIMMAPSISAESIGPIGAIRRSWKLTAGNFWRILGFVVLLLIAALVVVLAIHAVIGVLVSLTLGTVEPMSAAAVIIALIDGLFNAALTILFAVMLARFYAQLAGDAVGPATASR
jgi:hypothetical protein